MALLLAGLLEIVWAFTMKPSEGFTRLGPTVITLVAMIGSFGLLSISMKTLPLGTAYAVWTGIGAFIAGIVLLGEPLSAPRVLAAACVERFEEFQQSSCCAEAVDTWQAGRGSAVVEAALAPLRIRQIAAAPVREGPETLCAPEARGAEAVEA